MRAWGVGRRIYTGFAVVLVLLCGLAALSFGAASKLSGTFADYRETSQQTILTVNFVEDLFEARMASLKYRISPSAEAAAEVDANIAEIAAEKKEVDRLFASQEQYHEIFANLKRETNAYLAAFQDMRALQADREEIVARLSKIGPKARSQLTEVMDTAYRDGDPTAAHYAGIAQQELMLGRFYTERFLLTNAPKAFERAGAHLSEAASSLETLMTELQNPGRRAATQATIADVAEYAALIADVERVISARNLIRSDTLDTLGPKMQDEYDQILDRIVARQTALGSEGLSVAENTRLAVAFIALAAFAIGALTALMIARSVTGSVTRMASDMSALAEDNLEIKIEGTEHRHELGAMARALGVFKENALKVRALAEEKARADAAAEEERREMLRGLTASFGEVVSGAVAGDFSRRVPADALDDELKELAGGVNSLLETVSDGLGETGRVLANVADGDLGDRMNGSFSGAFADLQRNVNGTVERLSELVREISATTATVRSGAQDITSGAEALSARAEQQASSLEETAATMEEMSASVKSNADNSSSARTLASDASERAGAGGEIVRSAVAAMGEIEASASKIADIISVIDGLAFQTNLLALNAAVEAARAGDAGKGFAVVAAEVRDLAQRSSDASRDIRSLIETSAGQVSEGVRLVTEAGASLEGIVTSISQVEQAISQIAGASTEQASGVGEISSAISNMDEITQQNASMSVQSASNARKLAGGAARLQELMSVFKVGDQRAADAA